MFCMQRKCATVANMKTATIPSVRVEPELRAEVESLLADGQTVSEFVEASVRAAVQRARDQSEFLARGLQSLEDARQTGDYVDADKVMQKLQKKLDAARKRMSVVKR
jgi:Arc/MetJ-type ribon-helix-helix transcriptional regulator